MEKPFENWLAGIYEVEPTAFTPGVPPPQRICAYIFTCMSEESRQRYLQALGDDVTAIGHWYPPQDTEVRN